jgi:hypothetical protein
MVVQMMVQNENLLLVINSNYESIATWRMDVRILVSRVYYDVTEQTYQCHVKLLQGESPQFKFRGGGLDAYLGKEMPERAPVRMR